MPENPVFYAFIIGIASALSLPLGTITIFFWRPPNRILAFLMAFGAGALLAALTLDLVVPALEHGNYMTMAAGCIAGSILYLTLNDIINNRGGFLRKTSTTVSYFNRHSARRFLKLHESFKRIPFLQGLPEHEAKLLASISHAKEYPPDALLYQKGDAPANLYIIEEGRVQLLDPRHTMEPFLQLKSGDSFSRLAFITGLPNATAARTTAHTSVWVIDQHDFSEILLKAPVLTQKLTSFLRESGEVTRYLQERHGMGAEEQQRWIASLTETKGRTTPLYCPAKLQTEMPEPAAALLQQAVRFPVFDQLPSHLAMRIASFMRKLEYDAGEVIYRNSEFADRLYLIESGTVALIDPYTESPDPGTYGHGTIFGALSMITGAHHAAAAMAQSKVTLWTLKRQDFDTLCNSEPELATRLEGFLKSGEVRDYLEYRQNFHPDIATQWTRKAIEQIPHSGKTLPTAEEMTADLREHKNAPLAIWLGIFLDGIPESLVIGALLVKSPMISLSLLAGLFMSNYPEALSSSAGMRQQGMSFRNVLMMWSSLTLLTGLGAGLGHILFTGAPAGMLTLMEGIAAGAMLTVIAETMLPEAYLKGGSITGLSTLLGFLGAIMFKVL
ncbi:cyclic nucleotide-binding domain-containing protein [Prosthecochloris sp. CIB 2401]|uniref:cyclic nucleotide-binding domain-containing protein n=1 Tax=Prosthecochloris sp. CIB 2401 TaxID=1868325 RepID=UPI00080AA1BD|nr:cyclic nucleotide-binding domain-containing protein [Prosthecochloris sp. CIB 2401]ANT64494.1 MlotiK1 channel [Prosthecochloris sp. CIB 2401]